MDLKRVLMELGNHLVTECGLDPAAPRSREIRKLVRDKYLSSTDAVVLFTEFLNLVPEAQEFLAGKGVSWAVAGQPSPAGGSAVIAPDVVLPSGLPAGDGPVRVNAPLIDMTDKKVKALCNGKMRECFVTGTVGGMIRVQAVDEAMHIAVIRRDHVEPSDREKLDAILDELGRAVEETIRDRVVRELQREGVPVQGCNDGQETDRADRARAGGSDVPGVCEDAKNPGGAVHGPEVGPPPGRRDPSPPGGD